MRKIVNHGFDYGICGSEKGKNAVNEENVIQFLLQCWFPSFQIVIQRK